MSKPPVRFVGIAPSQYRQNALIIEVDCPHCNQIIRMVVDVQETKFSFGVETQKERANLSFKGHLGIIPPFDPRRVP